MTRPATAAPAATPPDAPVPPTSGRAPASARAAPARSAPPVAANRCSSRRTTAKSPAAGAGPPTAATRDAVAYAAQARHAAVGEARSGGGPPGGDSDRNAFRSDFLDRLLVEEQPATAAEAATAGPWTVADAGPRGWGVLRVGERVDGDDRDRVAAWLEDRADALLLAAALPGSGRRGELRLRPERGPEGYDVVGGRRLLGRLARFDPDLLAAVAVLRAVVSSPPSLALVLEAAGHDALEQAGRVLARRVGDGG